MLAATSLKRKKPYGIRHKPPVEAPVVTWSGGHSFRVVAFHSQFSFTKLHQAVRRMVQMATDRCQHDQPKIRRRARHATNNDRDDDNSSRSKMRRVFTTRTKPQPLLLFPRPHPRPWVFLVCCQDPLATAVTRHFMSPFYAARD